MAFLFATLLLLWHFARPLKAPFSLIRTGSLCGAAWGSHGGRVIGIEPSVFSKSRWDSTKRRSPLNFNEFQWISYGKKWNEMEMKRTLEVLLTIGDAFDFLVDGIFELLSMAWQLTRLLELLKRVWLRDLHRWPSESLQEHISSTISYPFKSTSYIFCYFIYIFIYICLHFVFYVFLCISSFYRRYRCVCWKRCRISCRWAATSHWLFSWGERKASRASKALWKLLRPRKRKHLNF